MGKPDDILKRLGDRVHGLRKDARYSQEAFADECGLDRTYMGGIEKQLGYATEDALAEELTFTS